MLSQLPPGKAVLFNGQGHPFELITRSLRPLEPGEILVKVLYTTLCGSDIHTYCGRRIEPAQVVLGHEIAGDILAIEESHPGTDFRGEKIKAGDRITWSIFASAADVVPPRPDMPQKSANLFKYGHTLAVGNDVFNGGLADYCILRPNTALIKISPAIPLKVAATISCAHSTTMGALRMAGEVSGKKVIVYGLGLLGLSCVAMCKEAGASWIGVVDNNPDRLAWGVRFGADVVRGTDALQEEGALKQTDAEQPSWPEADIVFDMTGDPVAMQQGLDALAVGGCAVWIGAVYPAKPVAVDAQKVVRKLLQIKGLHNYNYQDFVNATSFIEDNYTKYPFEELTEKEFGLEQIQEAFEFADRQKPVRVGIHIN
jgi:putative phosphonate catabolism associated alcohol dehydrogenase